MQRSDRVAAIPSAFVRAVVLTSVLAGAAPGASAQDPASSMPLLRQRYLDGQRGYPGVRPPAGALRRAYLEAQARWPAAFLPLARAAALDGDPGAWLPIGPENIEGRDAGRISTIALHPSDPGTIYIGAAQGGVWRTRDGGGRWTPLTDGECSLAMGAIALDPVRPDIVYAGTGELHFSGDSYYGCGLLRSTDGGDSWTHLGASLFDSDAGGARIGRIIVDAATAGSAAATTVYVASSLGVHRSDDSGVTWRLLLAGTATDLVVHPTDPLVLYAALGLPGGHATNGVYRTVDGGTSWTRLAAGFPDAEVGRIALALAPGKPGTLYAAVQDAFGGAGGSGNLLGLWKTTATDGPWTALPTTGLTCNSQCWYDLVLAVDPVDADIVYFGGVPLYRSTDGGQRFVNILRNIHVDQHAIAIDPRDPATVYVGNDGGLYRTRDRGTTWTPLNSNLAITQFYSGVAPHPYDAAAVIGGTQDNGTLEYSGAPSWTSILGADGGFAAVDHADPTVAYAETQWTPGSGFSGPRRRDRPGVPFVLKVAGIVGADRALFIPPLVMDPTDARVLYFGTFRLYRTANRGDQWSPISSDLTSTQNGRISAVAPAPSNPSTIWVGATDGTVQVTTDGGASWASRTNGLPGRAVTDIAVDHRDARAAIATVSGFGTRHIFRTADAGATWTPIDAGLPDVPVNAVITHPALGDDIYAGTDLGVFRSADGGGRWEPFNPNLPNVAVFDLSYSNETGRIIAATHGRGMFALAPPVASAVAFRTPQTAADALRDTVRLAVDASDAGGIAIADPALTWRALDPAIATVTSSGVVTTHARGTARIVASLGGRRDTAAVVVDPVPVAVTGLADSVSLVTGESRVLSAAAVDRLGSGLTDVAVTWSSTDPAVASVDAAGRIVAGRVGDAVVRASALSFADTIAVRVRPPSVVAVSAAPAAAGDRSSRAGALLSLLRIGARADGPEAVAILRLEFEVAAEDPGAQAVLVLDADRDGLADAGEAVLATGSPGAGAVPATVALAPDSLVVAGGDSSALVLAVRMSGSAGNGATFSARFVPAGTRSRNVRSGAPDRLTLPSGPVDSGPIATSLLADGEPLSVSENPVRGARVTFNFAAPPRRVAVYTLTGRVVADLTDRLDGLRIIWDLANDTGGSVAPGVYLVVFDLEGRIYRAKLLVARPASDPPPA